MASGFLKKAGRLATAIAALVAAGIVVATPQTAQAFDVYTTPGTHNLNGRVWRTTCEPYSSTKRCRTEIQATVVNYTNGRFVQTNGWAFNNLTYAASPRTLWNGNPIGGNGKVGAALAWTAADGRKWRTECDTAVTGSGGCRSYIQASVIESTPSGYRWANKWILNNMVRFTAAPAAPPAPRTQRWYDLTGLRATSNTGGSFRKDTAQIGTRFFNDALVSGTYSNKAQANYNLNRDCTKFEAKIGLVENQAHQGPLYYYFLINGVRVKEQLIEYGNEPITWTFDISKADHISIAVERQGADRASAAFAEPRLYCYEKPDTRG